MIILEWNVNQNVKIKDKKPLPEFAIVEIVKYQMADIFVLMEAFDLKGQSEILREAFGDYDLFFADRDPIQDCNEILIGVKKSLKINPIMPQGDNHFEDDNFPNYLSINIEYNKELLTIIGVRIRIKSLNERTSLEARRSEYESRRNQLETLVDHIDKNIKGAILVLGDFNNHECYTNSTWNAGVVKDSFIKIDCATFTPEEGTSLGEYKIDHIIARGISIKDPKYLPDFKKRYPEQYITEPTYCSGIPDHAILTATIEVDKVDS